ncbi:hypothetical protein L1286_23970 [Pseudoalteromonas sp. SMS1]|uniref:hypothetical protein n=1 Tax=Pseudoalteromonas sp. SMS1 TaxID=2908894 RepID=UPI001F1C5D2B|nr:hypothetical protein [Pseudoalteromonas sp. SMS1]MCF2860523.1 hypothetical protein [Pseudoalteromonas sp. SMS1]
MELSYPYVCNSQSEIPMEALDHLDKQIIDRVGGSFSTMFPQFAQVFRKTSQVIEKDWEAPKLVLKKGTREWLSFVVVQTDSSNLFFSLQPDFMDKEGELFDEDYIMLPESWREIYRWFNSFCLTDKSYCLMDWWNTPFRYEARLSLNEYEKGSKVSRAQTDKFAETIGCKREMLRCWLLTENEDALFINEEACDGKVFHVKGKQLNIITEIIDPKDKLDEYFAHYLSGMNPESFCW